MLFQFFALVVLITAATGHTALACDQRSNPHSLSCQSAVWQGALSQGPGRDFYVTPMSPQLLQGAWRPNQFTAAAPEFESVFFTHQDPSKPVRTIGITNRDGSVMGDLFIDWLPNERLGARANSWLSGGREYLAHPEKSRLELEGDPSGRTILLSDMNNGTVLLCRNFLRAGGNHLSCKFHAQIRGQLVMIGYLGLLPAEKMPTLQEWQTMNNSPRYPNDRVPVLRSERDWQNHRGGQNLPIDEIAEPIKDLLHSLFNKTWHHKGHSHGH